MTVQISGKDYFKQRPKKKGKGQEAGVCSAGQELNRYLELNSSFVAVAFPVVVSAIKLHHLFNSFIL